MMRGLVVLVIFAGCSAKIADGTNNLGGVDGATTGDSGSGSGSGSGSDGSVPLCATSQLYLNFDGQQLTQGASDATTNHAAWMQIAQGSAPRYRTNDTNRMGEINSITTGVRTQLASFPITVTTTRPTSGRYMMVVFGGTAQQVGSRFGGAVQQLDCNDATPNDVAWISDGVNGTQHIVNDVIGSIGFGVGLTATTTQSDCMCGWDNNCSSITNAPCQLGSPIARDPAARQLCPGLTSQDEVASIHKAFCE